MDGRPLQGEFKKFAPKGSGCIEQGYRVLSLPKGHPSANSNGRQFEHRLVMEQILGRQLLPKENVHHKNGNRLDNRPENLEVWNTSQPAGQRIEDKVAFAIEILRVYAPEKLSCSSDEYGPVENAA